MTLSPASRQPSLADVLAAIEQATDLSPARRRDLSSAVRAVCKALGRQPADIPADPAQLRRRLEGLSPEALGLAARRWANIRSLVLKAIGLIKPVMAGRQITPLLPGWQMLNDKNPSRSGRIRVAPVMRWMSERNIEPEAVTEADLLAYRDELFANSLRAAPEASWQAFLWQWNLAVREVEGFPQVELTRVSRKKIVTLPWSAFPPSLKEDTEDWGDWLMGKDILADGPTRPVRETTADTRNYQIRYFASALVEAGHDPSALRTLDDLVTLPAYEAGLLHLYQRNGNKPSSTLGHLAGALIAVARHRVLPKLDDETASAKTLKRMTSIRNKIDVPPNGLTQKNRERLLQFDDPEQAAKLIALPLRLKDEALSGRHPKAQSLVLADVAVAVELLLMTTVRIGNLHSTRLEINLRKYRNRYVLTYQEGEVKNSSHLEFYLPEDTGKLLDWYLKDMRVQRLQGISDALFIGEDGVSTKAKNTLAIQITNTVKEFTGLTVNPHLFRHAMALIYLSANPGSYQVMRLMLGHKSVETTTQSYTGAETKTAQAHFDKVILDLRKAHLSKPPKVRKKR
jgi:site-specific recombinase XerD